MSWKYRPGDLTRCLISKTVQHEMRKVTVNDPRVQVHGPIQASALHAPVLDQIHVFRENLYAQSASYLNSGEQNALEERLQIDERSFHFYATVEGQLAATVRVTAHPFELSALTPDLKRTSRQFDRYLELSRLIVDPGRQGTGIGKKVLYAAMLWANLREYLGFVAICRNHRREEFERFGLMTFEKREFVIPERNEGHYRFMWGTWRMIVGGIGRTYAKKRLKKRLGKIFGKNKEQKWKTVSPALQA